MNRDIQLRGITRRQLLQLAAGVSAGAGLVRAQTARSGTAEFRTQGSTLTLGNPHLSMSWRLSDSHLAAIELADHHRTQKFALAPDVFQLELSGGRVFGSSGMVLAEKPASTRLDCTPL